MSKKFEAMDNLPKLPRMAGPIPMTCALIVATEFCERVSYYGASTLFQNYMQHAPQDRIPGAFNMGPAMATVYNNIFTICCYTSPIIGAFVADKYLGRFRTILYFSIVYLIGWLILTVSSVPVKGSNYERSAQYSGFALPGFFISIFVVGLSTGGIKASVGPMCADQVAKEPYVTEKGGKEYIADPEMTIQSVYNWFYWAINIGALLGQYVCTMLEKDAYWKGYVIPTAFFVFAIVLFSSGYKSYNHVPPQGSIYEKTVKVINYALKRQKEHKAAGKEIDSPQDLSFKFLSYADSVPGESVQESKHRDWDSSFVFELRQTLKACSVFPLITFYWVAYVQIGTNLVSQAGQMTYPSWITNDMVNIIDPIVLLTFIPIFDGVIYPYLNSKNIHFGYIKRIALGMFLGGLSMVWSALVQYFIYQDAQFKASGQASLSFLWQVPTYTLIGLSEILTSIGSLEYAYTHSPESMKGMISALSLFSTAVGSLLGIGLTPVADDPKFITLYLIIAAGCFVAVTLFYWLFRKYDDEDLKIKNEKRGRQSIQIDHLKAEIAAVGGEV